MNSSPLLPLLWFLAILCLIPLALWLLKRTPLGGAGSQTQGVMRLVAHLPIAPNQRLLTVEVGQGEDRRWLVLGVTGQQISTLHVMPPQAEAPSATGLHSLANGSFAQQLGARLRGQQASPASSEGGRNAN
ncbi:flagellar biosynthetic protein FliO [Paucibacter sp. DJ1R-11]|uniref:FliO/MopB family protein n=1 Tax=Paucibacter sp. DJ1R-11 TaxID=2893556 RepID=UPI0021E412B2|nr:flagellar biosynthetic protein FliO [Paucibacter sp. DJ1R-11]MCV2366261.1 flagellar biosynthetic protein FliO [Paucibacter sp. DJ1R-11]